MLKVPVNIVSDPVVGLTSHMGPCPPFVNASAEGTLQGHGPGLLLRTHKVSTTVTHKGLPIVQQGHDVGPLVPHLTYPLVPNPWYGRILPGASMKVVFGAQAVRVGGTPAGGAALMLPMLTCGEPVPTPTAVPPLSSLNTVHVGLTQRDLLAGAVDVVATVALEWAFGRADFKGMGLPSSKLRRAFTPGEAAACVMDGIKDALSAPFKKSIGKDMPATLAKMALASLTGLAVSTIEGSPTLKVEVASPLLKVEVAASLDGADADKRPVTVTGTCPLGSTDLADSSL